MKTLKISLIAIALTSILMLSASCKKDYVCECTRTYTTQDGSTYTDPDGKYTFNDSQVRAADRCNEQEGSGTTFAGDYVRDCQLN